MNVAAVYANVTKSIIAKLEGGTAPESNRGRPVSTSASCRMARQSSLGEKSGSCRNLYRTAARAMIGGSESARAIR